MPQFGLTAEPRVAWPSNGISEVPFRLYTDPAQYQREQERIFKGPTWNYLCLAVELAKPGDYVATTIGETAVIVVRDAAGAINAFVNRCAHRGNLLCLERSGSVKEFSCIYHGWTYDLAGQLTGVAFEHGVKRQGGMPPEFRKDEHRLQRLRTAELGGLVFGTFSAAAPDLESYLGPDVTRGLLRVMNRTPVLLGRSTQVMPNNWKLYFENVKDTYHASILHLFLTRSGSTGSACRAASTSTAPAAITTATPSWTTRPRMRTTRRRRCAPTASSSCRTARWSSRWMNTATACRCRS